MADQLCDPDDLSTLFGATLDDDRATLLVEVGTAVVQATAGRPPQRIVEVVDDEVTLMGTTAAWLYLPQRPVTEVATVVLDDEELTVDDDYKVFGSRLWRACGWATCWTEPSTVVVTYTHGYPAGDQGLQLARGAVLALARGVYDNPSGANRVAIDDYSASYSAMSAQMDATPFLAAAIRRQYGAGAALVPVGGM